MDEFIGETFEDLDRRSTDRRIRIIEWDDKKGKYEALEYYVS